MHDAKAVTGGCLLLPHQVGKPHREASKKRRHPQSCQTLGEIQKDEASQRDLNDRQEPGVECDPGGWHTKIDHCLPRPVGIPQFAGARDEHDERKSQSKRQVDASQTRGNARI